MFNAIRSALIILILLLTSSAYAEVPHYINLQSMIFDMDGNITTSDFVGITVRIVDADGNELYTETHPNVVVQNGAINLVIGSASVTGELPPDILNPDTGVKFLDVMVDGTSPFGLMTLSSVPYAIYADKAMSVADDAIESRHIKDGTIEIRDLKPGIAFGDITGQVSETQIPASVTTDSELTTHIQSSPAHPASAISLTGPFASFVATNVQTAVEKIDMKLSDETINRRIAVRNTNDQLTSGNAGLQEQIDAEEATRESGDSALGDSINNIATGATTVPLLSATDITVANNVTTGAVTAGTVTADTIQTSDGVNLRTRVDDLQAEDIVLHGRIDEIDDVIVPIGTIIPFYDFDNPAITFTSRWTYCDGSVISDPDSPLNGMTLPDLSGRYLVGFSDPGTEGNGTLSTAAWDAAAVGNANHTSRHTHTGPSHTHGALGATASDWQSADHTHAGPSHTHTGPSHGHGVGTLKFSTAWFYAGANGDFYMFDAAGNLEYLIKAKYASPGAGGYTLGFEPLATQYFYTNNGSGSTGLDGTGATGTGGTGATGEARVGHTHDINHTHTADGTGTTGVPSSTDFQPRSIRVRYIMRIK